LKKSSKALDLSATFGFLNEGPDYFYICCFVMGILFTIPESDLSMY